MTNRRSRSHGKNIAQRRFGQPPKTKRIGRSQTARPVGGYRERGVGKGERSEPFYAHEVWHEPIGRERVEFKVLPAGDGHVHPVTVQQVRQRLEQVPARFTQKLEVVQFSAMTRKRSLFACYGMQWGPNIYLYPIEESLVETYVRPPRPQQLIEARMYGGTWSQDDAVWRLTWTPESIKDFYLNNVLIHELGHVCDDRNTNVHARERYANWFAIEYGYRRSRPPRDG